MTRYSGILLAEAIIVFFIVFVLLYSVLKKPKEEGYIKKRNGLLYSFPPKTIVYILLAAAAITYVISQFSYSGLTTALVFVAVVGVAPLMLNNAAKRIEQEEILADVILYCQNMGMLLKQNHVVITAVTNATEDLTTHLCEDARGLLPALEHGEESALEAMAVLEANYRYSCIQHLDTIILHMYFENANVDDTLIRTYQDDVARLDQDLKKNGAKRKALRLSYMFIAAGSVAAYWFFTNSLSANFPEAFEDPAYVWVNMAYVFLNIASFFAVDRYFNLNISKE